jgi:multiple sugar transport system substrate-binding protein
MFLDRHSSVVWKGAVSMKTRHRWLVALLAVLSLLLAACGGGAPPASEQPTAGQAAAPAPTIAPAEQPTAVAAAPTTAQQPTAAAEQPTTAAAESATAAPTPTPIVIVDPNAVKADPNKVQIRWFIGLGTGTDAGQVEIEQKVIEAFNASNPKIQLIPEAITYSAARDILSTEIASGNPPDIVGPVGVGGAEAFHGQWLDLSDLIKKNNYDLSQFDQGAVDFYKVGGEGQIGIPFAIYPSEIFYQRKLFDEAGLKYPPHKYGDKYTMPDGKEVEWNFDTLAQIAKILTVDANGKDATEEGFDPSKIVQYGYVPQWPGDMRDIGAWFGADSLVEKDGKTARIPPQWTDSWKWHYDAMWKSHFMPNNDAQSSPTFGAGNPFNSGKIAMALTFLWYTGSMEPDSVGKDWDIAVVPSHNGKSTALLNADTFRIFKGTKHPDETFEVLSYLLGEGAPQLLQAYGAFPARKGDQQAFFDTLNQTWPQKVDWQVAINGIAHTDNPSFEAFMPNYIEAQDRSATFFNLMQTTPDLDMDQEIAKFKTDLQAIFSKKQ